MLQRIDGYHGINDGLSAELICLSTNPYIELKQFIGCQVAVDQVTDSGQLLELRVLSLALAKDKVTALSVCTA